MLYFMKGVEGKKAGGLFKGLNKKSILTSSLLFAVVYFGGGVHLGPYIGLLILFYGVSKTFALRDTSYFRAAMLFFVFAAFFGAVKFLPSYELAKSNPRPTGGDYLNFFEEYHIKTGERLNSIRHLYIAHIEKDPADFYKRLPYPYKINTRAYVGLLPVLLFLVGFISPSLKVRRDFYVITFLFLAIALSRAGGVNVWSLLHGFPVFNQLDFPERVAAAYIFSFSVCVGGVLSAIERGLSDRFGRWVSVLAVLGLTLYVVCDLLSVNSGELSGFTRDVPDKKQVNTSFKQKFFNRSDPEDLPVNNIMRNIGVINGGRIGVPERVVLPYDSPEYKGETYFLGGQGKAELAYFSPNMLKVRVSDNPQGRVLVINQNYFTGWRVWGASLRSAEQFDGLLSTVVEEGEDEVTFFYIPLSFVVGALISAAAFLYYLGVRRD